MRSPISWMGGKFYEKNYLIPRMPVHKWYVEVFAGSCVLLLNKPKAKNTREFANDKFSCLVSFWEVLQDAKLAKQLQRRALRTVDSKYLYERYMRLDPEKLDLVDRAYRFLYLIKFGFNCYDSETEILTKKGWKYFKNLSYYDKVATTDGEFLYYKKPKEIQEYDYEGEMIKINHRSIDLLVTPNHNLYVRQGDRKKYEFVKANNVNFRHTRFLNSVDWNGEEKEWFYIPQVMEALDRPIHNFEKFEMDKWLQLLGWYITEGFVINCDHRISGYTIGIAQSKKHNRREIKDLLESMNIHYRTNESQIIFHSKQLWKYFSKLGKALQKHIPKEFLNLSKRQLKILFDTMIKGDGTIGKTGRIRYYTTSKKLADQVQEIAIKLGYNSTLFTEDRSNKNITINGKKVKNANTYYTVNIRKTKECVTDSLKHYKKETYKGKVYCCTVEPYHTVLVRRNGKVSWCGQSFMDTWHTPLSTELGKLKNITTTFRNTAKMLMEYQKRIQEVKFSNYDFRKCLTKAKPHPDLFLFLDPPYIDTHSYDDGYYKEAEKGEKMYIDMREHLQRHHDGGTKWMITCNPDNPYFDEMNDIIIERIDRRACINKNKERKDVKTKVIMNYDVNETGNVYELEFQDHKQGDHLSI